MSAAPRIKTWQRLTTAVTLVVLLIPPPLQSGDILRGGASPNAARPNSSLNSGAAAAAQARKNAQDALSRTSNALNAVKNMQAAARAAAQQSGATNLGADPNHPGATLPNVPDGLGVGGLNFISATGASAPTQSGTNVNITQNAQQALINWTTFNVGRNTTVNFDQSAGGADVGQWIAFNKVNDPSGSPSQILGKINAQGQVYVINQNGIIFGGTSQVNVHTLVASSLPINDNLISRGILNNPDAQFLFSALALPAGSKGPTNAFTPPAAPNTATGRLGDVTVLAGAQLSAPTSAEHTGGRIALIGPNVTNSGTISSPDGQTILAAGLQVGFDAHKSSDASLRGLDVYVGEVGTYAGTATNSGVIEAPRADVTLTGKNVNQLGAINSSTSVSLNGRVDLRASYGAISNLSYDPVNLADRPPFIYKASGAVTLGSGSVVQILPEWSSADRIVGTKLALPSKANLEGKTVHFEPDALLLAPNAKVTVNTGAWQYVDSADNPRSYLVRSAGQIYLDGGSMINVAGSTEVIVPLSQNLLTVQLRGAELANSPLQRGGILRGPSITVDLRKNGVYNGFYWVGTPLADLSGYLGLIQRSVGELTTAGGVVDLSSGSSVVVQKGAVVDVSGGYVNYGGGTVKTTRVWYGGHLLDIAEATPDKLYEGIYTGTFVSSHPRWAQTSSYVNALALTGEHYEHPYISGADAGALRIESPSMAIDGKLLGSSVFGPRQRENLPQQGEISFSFLAQQFLDGNVAADYSPTPPTVEFGNGHQTATGPYAVDASGDPATIRQDRLARVILSPELLSTGGFGHLTVINPDGPVTVPASISLNAPPSGSVKLFGSNINIEGLVSAPGGTINLTAYNVSPIDAFLIQRNSQPSPSPDPSRGLVTLSSGGALNAAGLIVDDRLSSSAPVSKPFVTAGGSVSISAFSADLKPHSVIDVSGGVAVSGLGKRTYGNGGSISILTGQDQNLLDVIGGQLRLSSELKGFSGAKGGSLTLQARLIEIGGHSDNPGTLQLTPDFFSQGGFATFALTGMGAATDSPLDYVPGVVITPGTIIKPVVKSYLAVLFGTGSDDAVMVPVTKPEGLRTPASLSFNALSVTDRISGNFHARGDIVLGSHARIETDAGGSVTLSGQTVTVLGSVISPGGTIVISGANKFPEDNRSSSLFALSTVYIGNSSLISAAGKAVMMQDGYGRRVGTVYSGGTITLSGNLVAEAGATLDVSGTSGVFDLGPQYLGDAQNPKIPLSSGITTPLYNVIGIPTRVDSNGGSIILKGGQELFVDAKLLGRAGGPTALGGTLAVSSGSFYIPPNGVTTSADINLTVTQSGSTLSQPFWSQGETSIGRPVLNSSGTAVTPMGYFAADNFLRGGFDSLQLGGNVRFSGPVGIKARSTLSVATGGVIEADSAVSLAAPYVLLGQPFLTPLQPEQQLPAFTKDDPLLGKQPYFPSPTYGTGSLTVTADVIDIGNLVLSGISKASFTANHGDIRGNGTLDIAGDLYLKAAQIYPTTAATFIIGAYDYTTGGAIHKGSVTIDGSGVRSLPFSAGGTLNVFASNIWQGGTLRAPIGTINLGWDGSGTAPVDPLSHLSAPVTQQLTLASGSITSVSAIDPITGQGVLLPYGLILNGTSWIDPKGVDISAGGVPTKTITISAANVTAQAGSAIDLQGGGDLYAYRWVSGNGGQVDVLGTPSANWSSSVTYTAGTLVSYKGQLYSARQSSLGVTPTPSLYWTQMQKSFAILPGYSANYAPYNPFNNSSDATNLSGDPGYVSGGLSVGSLVYLGGSTVLAAGSYTLLPARYALLPGALLVTPQSGGPIGTFGLEDGSHLVSGFTYNDLNATRQVPGIFSRFEVAPASVVRERAAYEDYSANSFFAKSATKLGQAVPRLPQDAGHLQLSASVSMNLFGQVLAQADDGGRGGLVDISSAANIFISGPTSSAPPGTLQLDAAQLSSFGAESLLIGGLRTSNSTGSTIKVSTNSIAVDNAGSPLTGPEIILVSNRKIAVANNAIISQTGTITGGADLLTLQGSEALKQPSDSLAFSRGGTPITFPSGTPGNDRITSTVAGVITLADGSKVALAANTATSLAAGSSISLNAAGTIAFAAGGTGGSIPVSIDDGTMIRVSSDPTAQSFRSTVASLTSVGMTIGSGARISGAGITLDSTYATILDPTATLTGQAISLNSGQISLQLDPNLMVQPTVGLVLAGPALQSLQNAQALALTSYTSLDTYGAGVVGSAGLASLAIHAGEIRGFSTSGGTVALMAQNMVLDNNTNAPSPGPVDPPPLNGTLELDAGIIHLGANTLAVDQFANLVLNATNGIVGEGLGGLVVMGSLTANTPAFTGAKGSTQTLSAGGDLVFQTPSGSGNGSVNGGLGASLTLEGAGVFVDSNIVLPSGVLSLHAKSGSLLVGSRLDVGGTAQTFYDIVKYTDGGTITLAADVGSVLVKAGGVIKVSAQPGGGNAGSLKVSAPTGSFDLLGTLQGKGGTGGTNGVFSLLVNNSPTLDALDASLNAAFFTQARSFRVRTGDVQINGAATSHSYIVTADNGAITVTPDGQINAAGATGGKISLSASGSITLQANSLLDVSGDDFDSAGKGGYISIEAGSSINGTNAPTTLGSGPQLTIESNAKIDLSVDSVNSAADPIAAAALAAFYGQFNGTLHLRAPQTSDNKDLQIAAINGAIKNASSITVEGYKIYTPAAGNISTIISNIQTNGNTFVGPSGTNALGYSTMFDRLFVNNTSLKPIAVIVPGAEVVNTAGSLALGSSATNASSDWNLATFRFGQNKSPGVLTLRASGNIELYNALSDGFTPTATSATQSWLWLAPLSTQNTQLPANVQSWSYRITSGADLTSADYRAVKSLSSLPADTGSLLLGKTLVTAASTSPGDAATTASVITPTNKSYYQVIRTGTGDIDITAGRNIQLMNQFATIYTAGVQVANPAYVFALGDWSIPIIRKTPANPANGSLGAVQQRYFVQYSLAGGNVTLQAQQDIIHTTKDILGNTLQDSERQLPTNWLYRRSYVDENGVFGLAGTTGNVVVSDPSASTTWWVDYSNFFEGVGALGGGNVTMTAGRDVMNVDAVIPTNARMPAGTPNSSKLVELGGGNLSVTAGRDVNGGVYYVERGMGTISAGQDITTNSTRSPSRNTLLSTSSPEIFAQETWLPTTLLLGKGGFDVSARRNLLIGPTANVFLLPQGVNNAYWYKTYFSTYNSQSSLDVASLGGDITFRLAATLPAGIAPKSILDTWQENEQLLIVNSAAYYQPWLRIVESETTSFNIVDALLPGNLNSVSFSGDTNLVGNLTLSPSVLGNLSVVASGNINGLRATGPTTQLISGQSVQSWTAAQIIVSDANPSSIPSVIAPLAYQSIVGRNASSLNQTNLGFLSGIDALFAETGSTTGSAAVIQKKQALHTPGILHANDFTPIYLYAAGGDISGLTLFTPKETRVVAGRDIADVSLYLQNVRTSDVSVIAAGRDIIAYDANTSARVQSLSDGNRLALGQAPQAGDFQANGPGTIEVLAGRNLDLGSGGNNSDGTGSGLTSLGNGRNPYLPFAGANIIAGAGIGPAFSLADSSLGFSSFISQVLNGPNGTRYLSELTTAIAASGAGTNVGTIDSASFAALPKEQQDQLALDLFYIVLRDAGRDHNLQGASGFGNYNDGFSALAALFPNSGVGEITTQGRDVRTKSGGNISLFAPNGGLTLQTAAINGALAPPGIVTESGGSISIFTNTNVNIGISRIFTLRGGDITIWSSSGNIAAGSSSKTVQSAPPTRVLIDPQSGDVKTDLAGLATGGGIGVLATVAGVAPGNVDLIAPLGTVDAGDAGIRATGNLNIAATAVLNASNIAVGGASAGTPTVAAPSAPNISGISAASSTAGQGAATAGDGPKNTAPKDQGPKDELPSIISVEVLGYGGSDDSAAAPEASGFVDDEERKKRLKKEQQQN